ncbi:MAG: M48 family metallopeptidase [Sedimentisphaerales bacterium]|nr:M48 family metallopeptidase [Sedimentisphaerales bacterium]
MWELIRANKRNSIILMALMAATLLLLGYVIGIAAAGQQAGYIGLMIAAAIWFILAMVSFSSGDQILLSASKAVPVTHNDHPQLFNVVEEMKIAAGLPAMPKIYIIPDPAPNAFATGRSPQSASVAVTAGLLGRLNRDELQGVIAHEISHILHRDILYVTLAGIMLGSIVLLSQVFLRGMFYTSGSRRRYSSGGKGSGGGVAIMLIIAIIAAILAPVMAQLLYFALSRKREYLADAGAARLTRYPEGLASALEKIAGDVSPQLTTVNKVTAPMYIVNPFKKTDSMKLADLTSTHPPISERIKILRSMGGASFKDYSDTYCRITHRKTIVPPTALTKEDIALRQAAAEAKDKQRREIQMRQVGDIMRKVNQFIFLTCLCGLKLKIPPDYKSQNVKCPRCQRILPLNKGA